MEKCSLCGTKLHLFNKPWHRNGRLKTGEGICRKCYETYGEESSPGIKNMTLQELRRFVAEKDIEREKVRNYLRELGVSSHSALWKRREVESASSFLYPNEILKGISGAVCRGRYGVLFATDHRLFFMKGRHITEGFAYSEIKSLRFKMGISVSSLMIATEKGALPVTGIKNDYLAHFRAAVDEWKEQRLNEERAKHESVKAKQDIADQLARFIYERAQDCMSQQEFDEYKAKFFDEHPSRNKPV